MDVLTCVLCERLRVESHGNCRRAYPIESRRARRTSANRRRLAATDDFLIVVTEAVPLPRTLRRARNIRIPGCHSRLAAGTLS